MNDIKYHRDIIIIGGGISGLSAAFFLHQKGYRPLIIEKAERLGGAIRSERLDGFLVEHGPNSTLDTTPLLHQLFEGVGVEAQVQYANSRAQNRYIIRNGKLIALPMSPPAFFKTKLFSAGAKLRLFKEPFIRPAPPDKEESLADFVVRRLGREFLDYAINPFVAGVYAGRPEELSVPSAFPKLHQLEQRYGSLIKGAIKGARERKKRAETEKTKARLLSFDDGLETVITALGRRFEKDILTGAQISAVNKNGNDYVVEAVVQGESLRCSAPAVLFTIPAHAYGNLPFGFDFPLVETLEKIAYPPVAMVFFGYRQNPGGRELDGFGFLTPEKEQRRILGSIWTSTIFSNRAPDGSVALTTFVGGSRQPELAGLDDEQLTQKVQQDLQELIGITRPPDFVKIRRWPKAIPQYKIGHQKIIDQISNYEKAQPGLFLSGNFRGGISVADCVKQSHGISQIIAEFLASRIKKSAETTG